MSLESNKCLGIKGIVQKIKDTTKLLKQYPLHPTYIELVLRLEFLQNKEVELTMDVPIARADATIHNLRVFRETNTPYGYVVAIPTKEGK